MNKTKFLEVTIYGNSILREKAKEIKQITPELRQLAKDMIKTMYENEVPGVGLAAPQIDKNIQMIVIDTFYDDEETKNATISPGEQFLNPLMPLALINPKILTKSEATCTMQEGCLSLPGINGDVTRAQNILLQATILDGDKITLNCGGLLARCLLHELDHLNGILFIDHVSKEELLTQENKLKKLKKIGMQQNK